MKHAALSRRAFLRGSVAALFAAGCSRPAVEADLPAWFERELDAAREEQAARLRKPFGANERIGLALLGAGTRGKHHLGQAGRPGVRLVAVCDVEVKRAAAAAAEVKGCVPYSDFRDVLARKDVDAVIIATPDHWHAVIAFQAMRAGKDVYGEKPLGLTVAEGRALVQTARAAGRVFQVGSQQRSNDPQFRLACELVRNGRLGKLRTIRTLVGSNLKGGPFPAAPVPPGLDWDFWLGQAPRVDYAPQRFQSFRGWYEYSGGKLTDWGAHHNDIAQWALDMDHSGPVAVEATGEEPSREPNSFNCHPTFHVIYTYANGVTLHCTSDQNGVRFEGENGWIFVARARNPFRTSDPGLIREPLPPGAARLEVSTDHFGNFLECVRSRGRPICDVEVGHRSATVCHLGVVALRTGRKLRWDPVREAFVDDAEANRWLSREMRSPWRLEA